MNTMTDAELDDALTAALDALDIDRFNALGDEADRREAEREARLSAPDALASAARWYAAHGIAVFPLQPRDKRPYPGSRGFKDATTDPALVRRWWTVNPQANIGLATGHRFDVIDIDGPPGYQSMADLTEAGLLPPILGKAYTPRGGRHLYVAPTGLGNTAALRPGIDYRGAGGYVLAPPSVGANGKRYDWLIPLDLAAGA